jgi:type IV secretion system protein VirB9
LTAALALLAAAAIAAAPAPAPTPAATPVAQPPAPDPRIRTRVYSPDTIYRVYGHTGYQIMVQLEPDDRVQTIAIGDASGWQITPNEGRNLVFLKPLRPTLRTNMSIVTDRRTYNFELSAFNGTNARPSDLTYVLRFHYPQPAGAKASTDDQPVLGPGPFNRAYSFEGSDLSLIHI